MAKVKTLINETHTRSTVYHIHNTPHWRVMPSDFVIVYTHIKYEQRFSIHDTFHIYKASPGFFLDF